MKLIPIQNYIRRTVKSHKHLYYIYRFIRHLKDDMSLFYFFHRYPITDVVVCGMPRSGSTLLFNILREMVRMDLDKRDGFFKNDKEYDHLLKSEKSYFVKKTHNLSWILIKRIRRKKTIGFFTHRDIRDIVVSMMQKGWIEDFDTFITHSLPSIINIALIYASVKNMHVYSYEELINNKIKIIQDLQNILNVKIDEDSVYKIIERTSIEKAKEIIAKLGKNQNYDPTSHLHKNHIRDAKIGKWKEKLTKNQIEIINSVAKDYLKYFNYEL